VSADFFILLPDGTREGPYAEEELLDLMDSGDIGAGTQCLHAATGKVTEAGSLFRVLAPVPDKPPPVTWKPAPFPDEETESEKGIPAKTRIRLLYRGSPCVLTYWRSVLLAAALFAGGFFLREKAPVLLAAGLLSGSLVLLLAVLHRMKSLFIITSVRVELRHGLLSRSSRELRLVDIRSINVTRTGFSGLLGIGSVTFFASAGTSEDITFDRVWHASFLKTLVRRLQNTPPAA
jgi:hypothetical protein